jgi:hypothetical protein
MSVAGDGVLKNLLKNRETMQFAGQQAKQYVLDNIGACNRIYSFVYSEK